MKYGFVNIDVEKYIISGVLNYPDTYFEICNFINENDFSKKLHKVIWIGITLCSSSKEKLDFRTLAFKIKEFKLSFPEENNLSLLDYLEAIKNINIAEDKVVFFAKELKKLTVKNEISSAALDVVEQLKNLPDAEYTDILNAAETTFYSKINIYENGDNEPIDLFSGLEELIEERGNDPKDDGIICPYPILRKYYGNFTPGDLYFFIARAKAGKSTFLMNLLYKICCLNSEQNTRGLIIDTELESYRVQYRLLSSLSGVNEYYIRTGKWRLNAQMVKRVRAVWPIIREFKSKIDHIYVGGKTIDEVIPIVRRWYRKNIEPFKKTEDIMGVLVYDYIKLSDELSKGNSHIKDYHIVGQKVDKLKRLATELQIPVLTSAQTNRLNEARQSSKDRKNDGNVTGLSDQINQFASNIYLYNKLTIEDLQKLHSEYNVKATHELIPIYTRNQGENAPGIFDLVKIKEGDKVKWVENHIYFDVNNFSVEEVSDLDTIVKRFSDVDLNTNLDKDDNVDL